MTLLHKRLIYLSFFVVFFVSAPLILLYATGYRYNTKRQMLQKTGAINIASHPDDAFVYINGQATKTLTPARMTNLLPQEYHVKIDKDGYMAWEKNVIVTAAQTTFIPNAMLFRRTTIPEFIEKFPEEDLFTQATSSSATIGSYEATFSSGNTNKFVQLRSVFSGTTSTLATVPSSTYVFYDSANEWLVAKDTKTNLLHLWHVNNGQVQQQHVIPAVKGFSWNASHTVLLYYNDFEIWTFDVVTGRKQLITRLAAGINKAVWHPQGDYIVFLSNNMVKATEAALIHDRQNFELLSLPIISDILLNEQGNVLYIKAEVGNQKGWFKAIIQ